MYYRIEGKMNKLKKYLEKYPNAHILDIGTGRGDFIALIDQLYQNYSEIIGIDITDHLIEINNTRYESNPKIKFIKDDILLSNLKEGTFDVVCLSNTLHHLGYLDETLRAMNAMVKEDGIIVINEMISNNLNQHQVSHKLLHHFSARIDRVLNRYHDETFKEEEILDIFKNSSCLTLSDYWYLDIPDNQVIEDSTSLINLIDRLTSQIKDKDNYPEIFMEAEEIKSYIKEHGFQSATQLLLILNKKHQK